MAGTTTSINWPQNSFDPEEHKVTAIFPHCSEEQLQSLAVDIRRNGLMEPLTLFEGKLIDGRARLKACRMARVEPRYQSIDHLIEATPHNRGEIKQLANYLMCKNAHRKHLTNGQRAAVAAFIHYNIKTTQKQCAKRLNVSLRSVLYSCKAFSLCEAEIFRMIMDGKISSGLALAMRHLDLQTQYKVIEMDALERKNFLHDNKPERPSWHKPIPISLRTAICPDQLERLDFKAAYAESGCVRIDQFVEKVILDFLVARKAHSAN